MKLLYSAYLVSLTALHLQRCVSALALPKQYAFGSSSSGTATLASDGSADTLGASHLSDWCAISKEKFLRDLHEGTAEDWILVMGNEAGGE